MRVLVTGATGFVGQYLIDELLNSGDYQVCALTRVRSNDAVVDRLKRKGVHCIPGDVTDVLSVSATILESQPDAIFNLAAQSFVPASWHEPEATLRTNLNGTLNVLEMAKRHVPDCVVHVCGSSEEYGLVHEAEIPITESNPLRPRSPYGVSKIAADLLGYQYAQSFGMSVVRTRAFNHTGVGRGLAFVEAAIARQTAEIVLGKREQYSLGNTGAVRDYTDVRDTVRAYRLLVEAHNEGVIKNGDVFNICSGKGCPISRIVTIASECASIPEAKINRDADKMRPSDVPTLIGDASKLRIAIDWEPRFKIEDTIKEMVGWQITEVDRD